MAVDLSALHVYTVYATIDIFIEGPLFNVHHSHKLFGIDEATVEQNTDICINETNFVKYIMP